MGGSAGRASYRRGGLAEIRVIQAQQVQVTVHYTQQAIDLHNRCENHTVVTQICSHGNHFVRESQKPGLILYPLPQPLPQDRKLGQGPGQMSLETGSQVEGENVLLRLVEAGEKI